MTDRLLTDAVEQAIARCCAPELVRKVEADPRGGDARRLWVKIQQSGFADALTPEELGGGGLGLDAAATIAMACGRHAMPLPMALTMPVRAALAASGDVPPGSITIAPNPAQVADGPLVVRGVPYGLVADYVLTRAPSVDWLLPIEGAARERFGGHGSLAADLRWLSLPHDAIRLPRAGGADDSWRVTAAALVAAEMAGAMERLLEMTIAYANARSQFGKPLGKQQAIQQQISVMAEHAVAARTAALIGLAGAQVDPLRAAIAKAEAGEAAVAVAAISHAVHGAIGMTEEFDLQLYTRRLAEWRGHYGGDTYWRQRLGVALLADPPRPIEFLQKLTVAPQASDWTEL